MNINKNLDLLSEEYLFSEVGRIIKSRNDVINLSVGDVKLPLPEVVVEAGKRAVEELGDQRTFRGYPPETGYDFFKSAVVNYYRHSGVVVNEDEVFVSDGIKSDLATFLRLFGKSKVLLPSPSYPAYIDANIICGNVTVNKNEAADIIIICSPDNPTGRTMSKSELSEWVDVAKRNGSIILFDAAYEAFVSNGAPRSIFEIEGARECAVEFCSMSKTAGFTGVRCGYTVVPEECGLKERWRRLKSCMSNGVSYITQRMAECALTRGLKEIKANIEYYKRNASLIMSALKGAEFIGGNSPYIWLSCRDSKATFFELLDEFGVGVTPGVGFGKDGEGHVRINSFCTYEQAQIASKRLSEYVGKNF